MGLFNHIRVETPESVELEFKLAGIGNRAYALCLDYLIIGTTIVIVLITTTLLLFYLGEATQGIFDNIYEIIGLWIYAIQFLIISVIYLGYFVFFETLWQGQTPGKRRVGIRVIGDKGKTVGITQTSLRALLRPVDDILFLGAFLIVFTKKEKRLGDLVAGTLVINEKKNDNKVNISLSPEAEVLARDLLTTAEIKELLPQDFALIREYLQRRPQMISSAKQEISNKMAAKIKEKINYRENTKDIYSDIFLEAVYWAYQQSQSYLPRD